MPSPHRAAPTMPAWHRHRLKHPNTTPLTSPNPSPLSLRNEWLFYGSSTSPAHQRLSHSLPIAASSRSSSSEWEREIENETESKRWCVENFCWMCNTTKENRYFIIASSKSSTNVVMSNYWDVNPISVLCLLHQSWKPYFNILFWVPWKCIDSHRRNGHR